MGIYKQNYGISNKIRHLGIQKALFMGLRNQDYGIGK